MFNYLINWVRLRKLNKNIGKLLCGEILKNVLIIDLNDQNMYFINNGKVYKI